MSLSNLLLNELTNSPQRIQMELEAGRSFSFGLRFVLWDGAPIDLSGITIRFTAQQPSYRGGAPVLTRPATISDAAGGIAQVDLQASELALSPEEYPFSITVTTAEGYTSSVAAGLMRVLDSTPDPSGATVTYTGVSPAQGLDLVLQEDGVVAVVVSHLAWGQGAAGSGGSASSSPIQFVAVSTGAETRPSGAGLVLWLCPEGIVPAHMAPSDLRFTSNAAPMPPTIVTAALSTMVQGASFTQALAASGSAPITWTVSAGQLPAGLTLTPAGVLSGIPAASGPYSFTVTATNALGTASKLLSGTVTATGTAPTITTADLGPLLLEVPFTLNLSASGATPITWAVTSGSLPSGLGLSTATGAITGTPTAAGPYSFTVTATNAYGSTSKTLAGTVAVANGTEHVVWSSGAPAGLDLGHYTDGGGSLIVANQYYTYTGAQGWSLTGARFWVPATASFDAGDLPITVMAWVVPGTASATVPTWGNPTATATLASVVKGTWNDVSFPVPIPVNPVNASVSPHRIWVGYRTANGTDYLHAAAGALADAVRADDGSPLYLAEMYPSRAANTMVGVVSGPVIYGIQPVLSEGA